MAINNGLIAQIVVITPTLIFARSANHMVKNAIFYIKKYRQQKQIKPSTFLHLIFPYKTRF